MIRPVEMKTVAHGDPPWADERLPDARSLVASALDPRARVFTSVASYESYGALWSGRSAGELRFGVRYRAC